ncbi:MAG: GtrA family protein [Propionibacteriales bacterium]|nr:GtrA family protein [Propionibacteriales bacterium]
MHLTSQSPPRGDRVSRPWSVVHELWRFAVIGGLAFVVDVGIFNALRYDGDLWSGPLAHKPVTSKIISVCVATMVSYLGNRQWTWSHRGGRGMPREVPIFFALNGAGMLIAVGCLAISHYALGFTSALADNIAANGVGLVLGTVFRFWSYRRFVFIR